MSYYNGEYEHVFFVVVKSDSHDTTKDLMANIKKAVDPWFFQISNVKEHKSARKGDVLRRDLYIRHTAFAPDIITFNEMLRALIWHYNRMFAVDIYIDDRGTTPKESRKNIL